MFRITSFLASTLAVILFFACGTKQPSVEYRHPAWSYPANIYELNTRQFTPEGTFAAAEKHLPRLRDMGVEIIWLMPVYPIGIEERKGELGSYYAISDYKAINPEFGTLADFRHFVDAAHELGFKVILDWVANHTSRDAVWLDSLSWYVLDEQGIPTPQYDWTDVAKLDYANPNMRNAMIDAMLFWVRQNGVDGFRCDVAGEVPVEFWERAVDSLRVAKPDIFMLAEAEQPGLHAKAFDMTYAWRLHHILNNIAKGKDNADSLRSALAKEARRFPQDAMRMVFTSNHDENSWKGSEIERMGSAAPTFAVLTYLLPGMPLVYNGQEAGFDRRLEFFKKDSIDWNDRGGYTRLYTTLNKLKKENRALWNAESGGELTEIPNDMPSEIFTFVREQEGNRVIALFNLSDRAVTSNISFGTATGTYKNAFTGSNETLADNATVDLAPWEYRVYVK